MTFGNFSVSPETDQWVLFILFRLVFVVKLLCLVRLFAIPWTVAHHAPLSMGFSRQEYWSGLLYPPPGDLPNPGIEPMSLMSPGLAGKFFTTSTTLEPLNVSRED